MYRTHYGVLRKELLSTSNPCKMATMKIYDVSRYNQEISKYKLLSSTAGVGAIVNTKAGFNVLIHDIAHWDFIKKTQAKVHFFEGECHSSNVIERSKYFQQKFSFDPSWNQKVRFVQDLRFLAFLKSRYGYEHLELLVSPVDLAVHEQYNSVIDPLWEPSDSWSQKTDDLLKLTIPATHFPKYFYNGNGELKHIAEWSMQSVLAKDINKFAPPFDIIKKGDQQFKVPLKQVNLALICSNGHLSEIPWSKFIMFKRQNPRATGPIDLFAIDDCCKKPDLKWTESTTRSEGFSSVKVECKNCEREGNGAFSFSLDGITGLRVRCKGHRPWVLPCDDDTIHDKRKRTQYKKELPTTPCDTTDGMQVALATANNVYFANNTSSLFIPYDLVQDLDSLTKEVLRELDRKFDQRNRTQQEEGDPVLTKLEYADRFIVTDKLKKMVWPVALPDGFFENAHAKIRQVFLGQADVREAQDNDLTEEYRFQEYKVFHDIPQFVSSEVQDLEFCRVELPNSFKGLFDVVCQINSLKITSVQMNFSRVTPTHLPDPQRVVTRGQNIYSEQINEVRCLPAVQSLGEGIFFSLDQSRIQEWIKDFGGQLFVDGRQDIFTVTDHYQYHRDKINPIKERYFLVHTLCHLIMKELEFTCGYPLASLKERLFISDRMAAFMIMTSDGSEGSMGGLVSQASVEKIEGLVINALRRAELCSSDPLCWEGAGSGLASLNLASCFSCSIVSETACEERNLGLDRRVALDREFGYFRDIY
jgi:hypothetical protein